MILIETKQAPIVFYKPSILSRMLAIACQAYYTVYTSVSYSAAAHSIQTVDRCPGPIDTGIQL
ncbi:hypothetical protein J6590_027940 [Homalodisca vitripennis]|nr:hypothetical protein J6590_027940 [Homalodisca vitripennis]